MADLVDRLWTLVRHGRDQGMKMNDVEDAAREIERLRKALAECGADFVTQPGTVLEVAQFVNWEFTRRMELANSALALSSKD